VIIFVVPPSAINVLNMAIAGQTLYQTEKWPLILYENVRVFQQNLEISCFFFPHKGTVVVKNFPSLTLLQGDDKQQAGNEQQINNLYLDDWLLVHRSITFVDLQLDVKNSCLFTYNTFIKVLYMFRGLPAHLQEVCVVIVYILDNSLLHSDDTRGCIYTIMT
jgi:hypothetical protein